MTTVAELIESLRDIDPETEIFVSSDHEGNSYRRADFSIGEIMCYQDGDWVACDLNDIEDGEYEGWEDQMVNAVVVW